jgi:hypothetical protein
VLEYTGLFVWPHEIDRVKVLLADPVAVHRLGPYAAERLRRSLSHTERVVVNIGSKC